MYDSHQDGITHINIHSEAKTQLGRLLCNQSDICIIHLEHGYFACIEGYCCWLLTGSQYDMFRDISGVDVKKIGMDYKIIDIPDLKQQLRHAIELRLDQHKYLRNLLYHSKLPFARYHVHDGKVIELHDNQWLVKQYENIRTKEQHIGYRLIIAGSRSIIDYQIVKEAYFNSCIYATEIVSGGASGVDRLGERLSKEELNKEATIFKADWNKLGKSAGYRRNEDMAKYAHGLLAIWDGVSRSTQHMIDIANRYQLDIEIIKQET